MSSPQLATRRQSTRSGNECSRGGLSTALQRKTLKVFSELGRGVGQNTWSVRQKNAKCNSLMTHMTLGCECKWEDLFAWFRESTEHVAVFTFTPYACYEENRVLEFLNNASDVSVQEFKWLFNNGEKKLAGWKRCIAEEGNPLETAVAEILNNGRSIYRICDDTFIMLYKHVIKSFRWQAWHCRDISDARFGALTFQWQDVGSNLCQEYKCGTVSKETSEKLRADIEETAEKLRASCIINVRFRYDHIDTNSERAHMSNGWLIN